MSFPRYPKYKDSGVEWLGQVPEHWTISRLKHMTHLCMGQAPPSEQCNTDGIGVPFLQGCAEFGPRNPTAEQYCDSASKVTEVGDLLFSVRAPVGRLNVADRAYAIGRGLCGIRPREAYGDGFLFKHLLRLLDFGREREGVDLSRIVLTHHTLKNQGKRSLPLKDGENPKLEPLAEAGGGSLHEKQKAFLSEIVQRVNDLFEGDLTDGDRLVYVNNVIKGKMLESDLLQKQAANNTKEQFAHSPDLNDELLDAIIDSQEAHALMSGQALASETVRAGLKAILLGPGKLYEALREAARQRGL